MPYTWNGLEFDDPTWQGGRQAGIAGALGAMAPVSGAHWNGIADWLSRAAAGFQGGQQDYLVNAFRVQQQLEQQRLQEEYRQSQIAENEAQAQRYQAQVEAAQREAEAQAAYLTRMGIDPNTPKSFIDDELRRVEREKQLADARAFAKENNLFMPSGNQYLDSAALELWKQQHPGPLSPSESLARDKFDWERRKYVADQEIEAAQSAEDARAAANTIPTDPIFAPGSKNFSMLPGDVQAKVLPGPVATPKKVDRRPILEKNGIIPRNLSGGAQTTGGSPKPIPAGSTQNPYVPNDDQMAAILSEASKAGVIPVKMLNDPDFSDALKKKIGLLTRSGLDRQEAVRLAIDSFVQKLSAFQF